MKSVIIFGGYFEEVPPPGIVVKMEGVLLSNSSGNECVCDMMGLWWCWNELCCDWTARRTLLSARSEHWKRKSDGGREHETQLP